jgi:cytochrome c
MHRLALALALVCAAGSAALANEVDRGRAIVEEKCARCHATGPNGASPLAAAPPFRTLGTRYPLDDLEEALAEGIMTGHPAMPQFSFEPAEISAIIAYLQSLQQE